jgi:tRNA A-37 threonylcarbamoyl transferase component Bud32
MPSTRSSDPKPPKTHILGFCYDDDDGCAFTARINDIRFHIIVDPANLKSKNGDETSMLTEYLEMLRLVRKRDQAAESEDKPDDKGTNGSARSTDRDSGVDVSADDERQSGENKTQAALSVSDSDPALDVQNWILRCFGEECPQHPDDSDTKQERNIQQWYEVALKYYEVHLTDDEQHIRPVQIAKTPDLERRVDDLLPHLPLPKKLRELSIPWVPAWQVTVLAEADDPPPVHPSLVRTTLPSCDQRIYYFKPVDPTQPQPPKREIELLHRIQSKGLAEEFNVPKLEALVGWKDSKIEVMGYLLSVIDDPVPLTKLLDSEVDESKRKHWARETKRTVELLHQHGIVWGDAKADNFLVDREDRLWVIDFGGSYTDGWVDKELNETMEGDEQAVEKIINGLKDPDNMTVEWNEEFGEDIKEGKAEDDAEEGNVERRGSVKRKREDVDGEEEVADGSNKASKRSRS